MSGSRFHQYPPPFALQDVVVLPDGKFSGARARVYHLLLESRSRNYRHKIGQARGPAGAVPGFLLREPWAGGDSGGRRLRELRDYGAEISVEEFTPPGRSSATMLYRLVRAFDESRDRAGAKAPIQPTGEIYLPSPLSALSFWLDPSGAAPPPRDAVVLDLAAVEEFAPRAASALAYLEQLREAWRAGAVEKLPSRGTLMIRCSLPTDYDPLAVFAHAIKGAGATALGTCRPGRLG